MPKPPSRPAADVPPTAPRAADLRVRSRNPQAASTAPEPSQSSDRQAILNAYKALVKDCMAFTSKDERKRIRRAFDYSVRAHGDARRKSGEPYILHPLAVARIVVRDVGLKDATAVCCALLHDVVEDTFAEQADIEREFGPTAAKIIDGLTKISGVFDTNVSKQAENFRKMLLTMSDDIRVALIKIADRLHNMRTLAHTRPETQLKIASETRYLYAPLAHRLGLYAIKGELEDLAMMYTEPVAYQAIAARLQETRAQRERYMHQFTRPIQRKLKDIGLQFQVKGRVKTVASIYEKMTRQNVGFDQVYDIFAIRIILDSPPHDEKLDCWRAYSAICSTYRPHPERTRDWVSMPRSNGYESLHVTVMGPEGRWVEVQIRTVRMDESAEKGLAAHWRYKGKDGAKGEQERERALDQWLATVREMLENQNLSALDFVNEFKSNLVPDEIYVFTPKGDMKVLPSGATALDFAYEIHTNLGDNCIGAKVNHQVVPLSYVLKNGDQVEVITSKRQAPKPEWLEFVITSRAIHRIKDALKEQRRTLIQRGKEIFDWKIRQLGIGAEHALVKEMMQYLGIPDLQEFYFRLGAHRVEVPKVLNFIATRQKAQKDAALNDESSAQHFDQFVQQTLGVASDSLVIASDIDSSRFRIAECCNPIPGDSIVGIADPKGGIVVHRTNCPRAIELMSSFGQRIVKAKWDEKDGVEFLAAFRIVGQDRMGMLSSIVKVVTTQLKRNIRTITIDTDDGMFEGTIRIYIRDTQEAEHIIELLSRISGVFSVVRL